MFKNVRYFSVAVRDMDEALKIYRDTLGLKQRTELRETKWGFSNIMLGDDEKNMVELVHVTDPKSPLARFMNDRKSANNPEGEGLYIVSVEVDDLQKQIKQIQANGGRVTLDPDNPTTAWVHPLSTRYAFIEMSQTPKEEAKPAARRTAARSAARSNGRTAAPATRASSRSTASAKGGAAKKAAAPARGAAAKATAKKATPAKKAATRTTTARRTGARG